VAATASYSLFFAVVSVFAFVDLCALRDLLLAVFALAVFVLADLAAADFADFLVVSCLAWPACWAAAACACSRGATANIRAATAAASVRRFMQLPPEGGGWDRRVDHSRPDISDPGIERTVTRVASGEWLVASGS